MKSDKRIYLCPSPVLEAVAGEITLEALAKHGDSIAQIVDTLRSAIEKVGAAGMAAPQVGFGVRLILVRGTPENPITVMINPTWEPIGASLVNDFEECFSTPGVRVSANRYKNIKASWLNLDGEPQTSSFFAFQARVIQHEIDHLDGKCLWDLLDEQERKNYMSLTKRQREKNRKWRARREM